MGSVLPSMFHIYKKASSSNGFDYVTSVDDYKSYIITDRWQGYSEIEIVYAPPFYHPLNRFVNQTLDNEDSFFFIYVSEMSMMFVLTSFDFTESHREGAEVILRGIDLLSWMAQGYLFTVKEKEYKYNNRSFLRNLTSGIDTLNNVAVSVTDLIAQSYSGARNAYGWESSWPLYNSETISVTVDGGSSLYDVMTNYFIQMGVGLTFKNVILESVNNKSRILAVDNIYTPPFDRTNEIFSISDGQLSSIRFYKSIDTLVNHVTECGQGFDDRIRYTTDAAPSYSNKYMKRMHYVNSSVSVNTIKQLYGEDNPMLSNSAWVNGKIDMIMHADAQKFLDEPKTLMECVYNHTGYTSDPNVGEVYTISASIFDTSADMIIQEKITSKSGSDESVVLTIQDTTEVFPWL